MHALIAISYRRHEPILPLAASGNDSIVTTCEMVLRHSRSNQSNHYNLRTFDPKTKNKRSVFDKNRNWRYSRNGRMYDILLYVRFLFGMVEQRERKIECSIVYICYCCWCCCGCCTNFICLTIHFMRTITSLCRLTENVHLKLSHSIARPVNCHTSCMQR